MEKIDFLKKITLSIEAGTTPDKMNLSSNPRFEFIYGLGTGGLTPLEFQLADKTVGDEVHVHITRQEIPDFFQHLTPPPLNLPEHIDGFYAKLRVLDVVKADEREVIKAMADMANCDDHCCGH